MSGRCGSAPISTKERESTFSASGYEQAFIGRKSDLANPALVSKLDHDIGGSRRHLRDGRAGTNG